MLNKVILIGRLTRDPELMSTPQGISTCSFSLAVERNYQNAGGERQTDFINCVAWRQTAEFIPKYFQKGNLICVEGSIQTRNWKDKDGNKHYVTEVMVDGCYFVESKADASIKRSDEPLYGNLPEPTPYLETDDLPF